MKVLRNLLIAAVMLLLRSSDALALLTPPEYGSDCDNSQAACLGQGENWSWYSNDECNNTG